MRKHIILFTSILILFTSMISAYSYSSSSLGEVLDSLGGENLGLMIIFLVSFALVSVILKRTRFFEQSQGASTVISLMLAFGIAYFGFYKSGMNLDVSGLFYGMGFSDSGLDLLVFFGTLAFCALLIIKFKSNAFLIVGGFLIALFFTGILKDLIIFLWIGIGLVILWAIISFARFGKYHMDRTTIIKGGIFGGGGGRRRHRYSTI